MKITEQNSDTITIQFSLLDFDDLREFFLDNKIAVDNTGKYQYEVIQRFLELQSKYINSTEVNDLRLKRIDKAFDINRKF